MEYVSGIWWFHGKSITEVSFDLHLDTVKLTLIVRGLEDEENVEALDAALKSKAAEALEACLPLHIRDYPAAGITTLSDVFDAARPQSWHLARFKASVKTATWHAALDALSAQLELDKHRENRGQ